MLYRFASLLIMMGSSCWVYGAGGEGKKNGEVALARHYRVVVAAPGRFINKSLVPSSRNPLAPRPSVHRGAGLPTASGGIRPARSSGSGRATERFGDTSVQYSLEEVALEYHRAGVSDANIATKIRAYAQYSLQELLQVPQTVYVTTKAAALSKVMKGGFFVRHGQFRLINHEENKEAGRPGVPRSSALEQTVVKLSAAVDHLEQHAADRLAASSRSVSVGTGAGIAPATGEVEHAGAGRGAPKVFAQPKIPAAPIPGTRRLESRGLSATAHANNRTVVPADGGRDECKERDEHDEHTEGAGDGAVCLIQIWPSKLAFAVQEHLLNSAMRGFGFDDVGAAREKVAASETESWLLDVEGRRRAGLGVPTVRVSTADLDAPELS